MPLARVSAPDSGMSQDQSVRTAEPHPVRSRSRRRSRCSTPCWKRASIFGGGTLALVDGDGRVLTYDEIIRASFALGDALKNGTRAGEYVGVMLPTGAGAAIAFFALSAYGRVPTMLNFTSRRSGLEKRAAHRPGQAHRHRPPLHRAGQVRGTGCRPETGGGDRLSGRCARQALAGQQAGGGRPAAVLPRRVAARPDPNKTGGDPVHLRHRRRAQGRGAVATKISWPMSPRCAPISIFTTTMCCSIPCPSFIVSG